MMRRRVAVLSGLFLASLLMSFASAPAALAAEIDKGLYFGGGVGSAGLDQSNVDFSGNDNGWKAIVGWRIFKFLAVEGNYVDFGNVKDDVTGGTDLEVATTGYDLSALGIIPFGGHFEVFGRFGYVSWDATVKRSGTTFDSNEDGEDAVYGLGAAFRLGESLQIRVEYEKFGAEANGETVDVDFTSASATFTF